MALSGSFTGSTANDKIIPTIIWSATQSVSGNYSEVVAELRYSRTDNLDSYGYWTGSITINGTKIPLTTYEEEIGESVDNSRYITITRNSNTLAMKTPAVRVPHNSDGSKSITISAAGKISGTTLSSTTISKTITLDTIPRKANILTAPDFNDEQNPTITYNNSAGNVVSSLQACISFDGVADNIAYRDISKTGSSYTFNLTTAERNILRNGTTTANSREIKFYIKTVIGENTYYSSIAKTLTIINANPTINPTVKDTGTASTVLTGDGNNKLIKEHNFMSITIGAAALKGATIKSQKVECGSKSFTTATGSLSNVSSGSFKFTVVDSRGNTTTKTVTKTLIDYVKLTCNLSANAPTTDGNMSFTVSGNYFNGSFGAVANTLTVQYRYKVNDGAYTDWVALTATNTNNTYKANGSLSGLDYRSTYTIQARAIDKIYANVLSAEKRVKTTPVFDWGENDFNFNVPVAITDGDKSYNLLGLAKALSNTYSLATTYTAGSGYTSASGSNAVLMGGNLRCHYSVTRATATGAGNIANEIICSVSIKHDGKIKSSYRINFANGATGGVATLQTINEDNDGTYLTFDIQLMATHAADTSFSGYFILPCVLNLDAF